MVLFFLPFIKKDNKIVDYTWAISYNTSDGDDREKGPPVLIPNTEVKLLFAEDTWLDTAREIRTLPSRQSKAPHEVPFLFLS